MKKLKEYFLLILIAVLVVGCEKRDNYDDDLDSRLNVITSLKGGDVEATIDDSQGIITLVLPPKSDMTNIVLTIEAPQDVVVVPNTGTNVDLSQPIELRVSYGDKIRKYTLSALVLPSKIAFLGDAPDIETLISTADDDVAAAAKWTKETYGSDFVYLDANNVSYEDLSLINVVVFYYDQVGSSTLPPVFTEGQTKSTFIKYIVNGGKMVLGGFGNCYAQVLGRDKTGMMTIVGSGTGGPNPDIWAVKFTGSALSSIITEGITKESNGDINIIDGGFKEDHNAMWSLTVDAPQYANFASMYDAEILGTWNWNLEDEGTGGVIFWDSDKIFKGRLITIGLAGMEWSMNDGRDNPYLSNVHGIYKNSIDYLSTK